MKRDILERTAKEYFQSGKEEFEKGRYNAAVVLFFKAIAAITDIYILDQTGKTPSSHNERFSITKQRYSDVYDILDKDFPYYQDSYVQIMSKELAEVMREDAQTLAKKARVALE